ncbi:MAG: saccharopine dehydrogenase NADP-binding domain-containing protein [Anaerolineales bacterium]|uniref:Saccharopine dehydrogenase NADP-binding domain-containing protein n=1 Tax=Candidatus Desulfolinea nitratireducens TaxID=2841698 RepID=A0A8J6NIW2_9CHLR|nr:saccharopine dehydrogenase NADP-binding domain-containing protein [Candidatus Desulfolinea nitratireducens]MBL6961486.1 saccharopine dehydrogenase NADP-binding domain-containing protein [Anaerolineales bacterium]
MRIFVLGGAGKMGCISVQSLAMDDRVDEVIIADINTEQAQIVADYIDSPKIKVQKVDITDEENFVTALKGSDVCLNAAIYYMNLNVMEACLKAGVHYTDMGGLFYGTREQLKLHARFAAEGLSAVLCMGSAPGVPNIQTRYAADRLDSIESIRIYDGIKPPAPDDPRFSYAVPTILDELTVDPMVFENGEFVAKPPLSGFEDYWFEPPLGMIPMHLSLHSEVATLPVTFKDMGVKECFFKINYWGMAKNTVEKIRVLTDYGFTNAEPVNVKGISVAPRDLAISLLADYVHSADDLLAPPTAEPPDWAKEIVTEIRGTKDGEDITYRLGTLTCKGALPTGLAPAIAAIWLAEGRVEPGVYPPEACLDPEDFFKELEKRDIITKVTVTQKI